MLPSIVLYCIWRQLSPKKWRTPPQSSTGSQRAQWIYTQSVIDIPVKNMTAYAQPSWQMTPPLSLRKTSVCERQKSSLIFVSLWPMRTQAHKLYAHTHNRQDVGEWSVQSPGIKYVLHNCWNTSRLFSTHRLTLSPSICLLSLAHHTLSLLTHAHKALNYGWTPWHCDDTFVTSIQSHSLKSCPSLCRLEFTFCHLTFTERLMTALSADVSLLLTLNPDCVDTDTDSTWGPEVVQNTSSIFELSFEVQLSSSFVKEKSSVLKGHAHSLLCFLKITNM